MPVTPEFRDALSRAHDTFFALGDVADDALTESGDMRAVGIARSDVVQLCSLSIQEFGPDLMAGGPEQATALLGILETALATGVWLERSRWEKVNSVQ
jgi:hypothetical protein